MRVTKSRSYNKRRISRKNIRRKSLTRSNRMRGGNANALPSEYFGNLSGKYSGEEFSNPGEFAYGVYSPQSYGEDFDGMSHGPNMGVYSSTGKQGSQQTGGYKKLRSKRNKRNKRSKRSKRSLRK